jgi:BTB/POZ domain
MNTTTTRIPTNGGGSMIGLHVGSRVFYCHRSTLVNNAPGSYFERRFGLDRHFEDDVAYVDSNGINIFFIERDGGLFVHVLRYLTKLKLNLPSYRDNQEFWRDLRDEAEFFGLDGLLALLQVTHSCPFHENMRGVFYWLGTGRGSNKRFENPLLAREENPAAVCQVAVGIPEPDGFWDDRSIVASPLLEHRQPTAIDCHQNIILTDQHNAEFYRFANQGHIPLSRKQHFNDDGIKVPLVIQLGSMRVSFELLEDKTPICLEASCDGMLWDRLALEVLPQERTLSRMDLLSRINLALQSGPNEAIRSNSVVDVAEAYLRKNWQVEATSNYYKHFRFCYRNGRHTSLAGVALEMFGDIHER